MLNEDTFEAAQRAVDDVIRQLGGYWPPLAMLASVTEEVGELARILNHKEQIKVKKESEVHNPLGEELADTLFSLICIANYYDIDLGAELKIVLKKYLGRDLGRFPGSSK